jgi:hypothetical protein
MNSEFKLRVAKLFINLPFSLLDRFLKFPRPSYPQTRMLHSTYQQALRVYAHHAREGVFGPRPDGNFPRFLSVTVKLLTFIAEEDRYYRAWLGLAFFMASKELAGYNPTPAELKRDIKRQWLEDIDFIKDAVVERYRRDFIQIALTQSLGNLFDIEQTSTSSPAQRERSHLKQ